MNNQLAIKNILSKVTLTLIRNSTFGWAVVTYDFNPSTGEAETIRSLCEFQDNQSYTVKPYLKKTKQKEINKTNHFLEN